MANTDSSSSETEEFELPFRPKARLLQLLGDQLIGSPRLAVFELVKNAYDADAARVDVELGGLAAGDPYIQIVDDGVGMSLETIRDIWLVPAHGHREQQRNRNERTEKGRLPLGAKGLGRFAVHKLGDKIRLVTRAEDQRECVVDIDWAAMVSENMLSDANVQVRTRNPKVFHGEQTGTRITITELRHTSWSRGDVRRLLKQLTSIASPFDQVSDEFVTELYVPDHPEWIRDVPDVDAFLRRAPWYLHFRFENGRFDWEYEFRGITGIRVEPRQKEREDQPLKVPPPDNRDDTLTTGGRRTEPVVAPKTFTDGIGPVEGTFYVFDRDKAVLAKIGDTQQLSGYLDDNGGVRVYRDGVRVYNYGEPGEDWLGLDIRRVNAPTRRISNNIVLGAIDLDLEHSSQLAEKTNREGFDENSAYDRLKRLVIGAIGEFEIERKIDKDAIRKLLKSGKAPTDDKVRKPLEKLRKVAKKTGAWEQLGPLINRVEKDYGDLRDTLLRSGLSNMGLTVVFHEVEHGVRALEKSIAAGVDRALLQELAKNLIHALDGFTEIIRKGDQKEQSLNQVVRRARDTANLRFRHHRVKLDCPAVADGVKETNSFFTFSLILAALTNIIDNAIYWLQVRWPDEDEGERRIHIHIDPDFGGGPAIIVADNGPGFEDDPEAMTTPFFTRRPDGMGVGLYYANLVMEMNGGHLAFPDADEADVPEEFDGAVIALVFAPWGEE